MQRTGKRNVAYLDDVGISGSHVVLAHVLHTDEAERALLAARGTAVAHCPSSNLKLASGVCPVPEYRAQGIRVTIGADGAPCNDRLDAFMEMRLAALLPKVRLGPGALSAWDVVRMATAEGASALSLPTGTLETRAPRRSPASGPRLGFRRADDLARRPVRAYRLQHGPVARRRDVRGRDFTLPPRGVLPPEALVRGDRRRRRGSEAAPARTEEVIAMSKKAGPFLKNILVGTDFSLCAARAFSFAASLAASQGAKIHLVHVLVEPVQAFDVAGALPYLDVSTQKEWEEATRKRLAAAVASAEKRGVNATSEFLWGRPSDAIVETAVKTKASLVVLGTHGRNALEKLLIGSTAERVVRLCPVPVLTVREKR